MPFTFHPHESIIDLVHGVPVVKHSANYVMLSNAGDTIYIQAGQAYHGDTDNACHLNNLPGWFWDSARQLTPAARKACGLKLPEDEIQSIEQLPAEFLTTLQALPEYLRAQLLGIQAPRMPVEAPKSLTEYTDQSPEPDALPDDSEAPAPRYWTCGECGASVELRVKGLHIGQHTRAKNAETRAQARAGMVG